jgi:hypothetical protein
MGEKEWRGGEESSESSEGLKEMATRIEHKGLRCGRTERSMVAQGKVRDKEKELSVVSCQFSVSEKRDAALRLPGAGKLGMMGWAVRGQPKSGGKPPHSKKENRRSPRTRTALRASVRTCLRQAGMGSSGAGPLRGKRTAGDVHAL